MWKWKRGLQHFCVSSYFSIWLGCEITVHDVYLRRFVFIPRVGVYSIIRLRFSLYDLFKIFLFCCTLLHSPPWQVHHRAKTDRETNALTFNLELAVHQLVTCFGAAGGSRCTLERTHTRTLESNPSHCEVTVLTTAPKKQNTIEYIRYSTVPFIN